MSEIIRKININGVDYNISPVASEEQLGMVKLGPGLDIGDDGTTVVSGKDGITSFNESIIVDEGWLKNYLDTNFDFSATSQDNLNYFKIMSLGDNSTISLPTNTSPNLMYSLDGINWTQWNYSTITLSKDDILYLKGDNSSGFSTSNSKYNKFSITGKVELGGNIMSLLYGDNFENNNTLPGTYTFYQLFYNCTGIISAKDLILPATTLANYCYYGMFRGCTSLTEAPELPATTLAQSCYNYMFQGCTSLTTAPELKATTLASGCYSHMFDGCSKLNYIKMLATNISANSCLYYWVEGVASSGTFVKNTNMTSLPNGVSGIPNGWTVVNNIFNNISPCIINQASESITFVYSDGLFTPTNEIIDLSQHFTKDELLSVQPECEITVTLQDKTDNVLASDYVWANDNTLGDVLNELGVSKDVYDVNVIITKVNAPEDNGYYYNTIEGNPYSKEFFTIEALKDGLTVQLSQNASEYRIDNGEWISLAADTATPSINSGQKISFKITNPTISSSYPYYGIGTFTVNKAFNVEGNIMSLLYGDNFEVQTDLSGKDRVFYELFYSSVTLQNAENLILPATTLAKYCYREMFNGCTNLTTAPELPATKLTTYCYRDMFSGCSKLNYIKMLATDISASYCLTDWVNGVASTGTFVKNANMTSLPNGVSGIPNGWTVENA